MSTAKVQSGQTSWRAWGILARCLVGGMFLIAATGKLSDPAAFADEIRGYRLAPIVITNAVAYILPWVELLAALLLIPGVWRRETRFLLFVMLLGFTAAKLSLELRGIHVKCGCGGKIEFLNEAFSGWYGVLLNGLLMSMLVIDWAAERVTRPAAAPAPTPPATAAPAGAPTA
jgi:hypothetical protein